MGVDVGFCVGSEVTGEDVGFKVVGSEVVGAGVGFCVGSGLIVADVGFCVGCGVIGDGVVWGGRGTPRVTCVSPVMPCANLMGFPK